MSPMCYTLTDLCLATSPNYNYYTFSSFLEIIKYFNWLKRVCIGPCTNIIWESFMLHILIVAMTQVTGLQGVFKVLAAISWIVNGFTIDSNSNFNFITGCCILSPSQHKCQITYNIQCHMLLKLHITNYDYIMSRYQMPVSCDIACIWHCIFKISKPL